MGVSGVESWGLQAHERWVCNLGIVRSNVVDIALAEGAAAGIIKRWVGRVEVGCIGLRAKRLRALVNWRRPCSVGVEVLLLLDWIWVWRAESRGGIAVGNRGRIAAGGLIEAVV